MKLGREVEGGVVVSVEEGALEGFFEPGQHVVAVRQRRERRRPLEHHPTRRRTATGLVVGA